MQPPHAIVAFVHLPRTAGTAIREAVLRRAFPPDVTYFVEENPLNLPLAVGEFGGPLSALAVSPKAVRDQVRLLVGQMPLDLELLFSDRSVHYLTVLRDPVERAISTYFYCRSEEDNAAHSYALSLSAAEFAEQGYGEAQNGMTRFLSGATWGLGYSTGDQMLAAAVEVLSRCSFIGLYESLGKDVLALQSLLGLPHAELPRINERPRDRTVGQGERDRIEAANRLDLALYRRALAMRSSRGGSAARPDLRLAQERQLTPFLTSGNKYYPRGWGFDR
jgi:hypothetical protein